MKELFQTEEDERGMKSMERVMLNWILLLYRTFLKLAELAWGLDGSSVLIFPGFDSYIGVM